MKSAIHRLVVSVLLLWAAAASVHAATYYVAQGAPHASDENPGTEQQPFLTISKAANVAEAGDIVLIQEGIYREGVAIRNAGAAGKTIAFRPLGDDRVIIRGSDGVPANAWTLVEGTQKVYRSEPGGLPIRRQRRLLLQQPGGSLRLLVRGVRGTADACRINTTGTRAAGNGAKRTRPWPSTNPCPMPT